MNGPTLSAACACAAILIVSSSWAQTPAAAIKPPPAFDAARNLGGPPPPAKTENRIPVSPAAPERNISATTVPRPSARVAAQATTVAPQPAATGKLLSPKTIVASPRRTLAIKEFAQLRAQENTLAQHVRLDARTQVTSVTEAPGQAARVSIENRNTWRQANAPGILTVNRKARDFLVTPGGYLTIVGNDFGDTLGEVNVIGRFPAGKVPLQVVNWRSGEIYALLPEGLRGVADQSATLQVITRAGKTYRIDGARFVAAREEILLTNVERVLDFQSASHWPAGIGPAGHVSRAEGGAKMECKAVGADTFGFKSLAPGWEIVAIGMQHGRTDSGNGDGRGNPGGRTYSQGYALGPWADRMTVNWGVWRSHLSPNLSLGGYDHCESSYLLSVYAIGPAGLLPF